eukprot:CAMPEP_0174919688 /NCGR_PEP_ID=MMETSP1355-20121228/3804_1 /TAXON_ID=464990 /ORGANISM="Hemiselmis tepida, Strain CCMP443" /LENGTH=331 /DNA_ID=CAMNT_0016164927 /DNA_START=229 /DNA_END=1221 /DNA_ORIENTATION=-
MSNVRADGIVSKERAPDCYLKVDFDKFKTFKTESIKDSLTPSWDKTFGRDGGLSFRYTTSGGGLAWKGNATTQQVQALSTWMSKKHLEIQLWNANMFSDEHIGDCRIDLLTLCTGPDAYTLNFRDSQGRVTGHLYMSLTMSQVAEVRIEAASLRLLSLPEEGPPGPYTLDLASNLDRQLGRASTHPSSEAWCPASFQDALALDVEATLRDLCESTLNVAVMSSQGVKIATSQVPLAEKILACHEGGGHSYVPFTAAVRSRNPSHRAVGELTGAIRFDQLPVFTPLYDTTGGLVVDAIVGGQALFPFVPLPPLLQAQGRTAGDLNPKYGGAG